MPERWQSDRGRRLAQAVRRAGGTIERAQRGRIRITGPVGSITLQEPKNDERRQRPDHLEKKIAEATGLQLSSASQSDVICVSTAPRDDRTIAAEPAPAGAAPQKRDLPAVLLPGGLQVTKSCGKLRFGTRTEAESSRGDLEWQRAYFHRKCGGWHLTSSPSGPMNLKDRNSHARRMGRK